MIFFRKQKIKKTVKRVAEVLFREAFEIIDNKPDYLIEDAFKDLFLKYTPKDVQKLEEFEMPDVGWDGLFLVITWQIARKELGLDANTSTRKDFHIATDAIREYLNWRLQNPPWWFKPKTGV